MTSRLPGAPSFPRVGDRIGVLPIEYEKASIECRKVIMLGTIDKDEDRRTVWVFLLRCQVDWLDGCVAIFSPAVGQKRALLIGPQTGVEGLHPLFRASEDQCSEPALQHLLQQLWQRSFKRQMLEMIEADLGHELRTIAPALALTRNANFVVVGDQTIQQTNAVT